MIDTSTEFILVYMTAGSQTGLDLVGGALGGLCEYN